MDRFMGVEDPHTDRSSTATKHEGCHTQTRDAPSTAGL